MEEQNNTYEILQISEDMLEQVAEIERECFSKPWSKNSLRLLTDGSGVGFAASCDGRLCAYGGMTTVLDEGQITNVATLPEYRRQGLARKILIALEDYAKSRGVTHLSLEVRQSNSAAIELYSSLGWSVSGVRRRFYSAPSEDALVMLRSL